MKQLACFFLFAFSLFSYNVSSQTDELGIKYLQYLTPDGKNLYRSIYIWNKNSGNAERYYYDNNEWKKSEADMPKNPLGDRTGKQGHILMDVSEMFNPEGTEQWRSVVYLTNDGEFARWYYENGEWKKSEAIIPEINIK